MHFCIFVIALFKWCGRKAAEGGRGEKQQEKKEDKPRVKKSTVKGGRIWREQHQEEEKRDKTNTKKERKKKKKRGQGKGRRKRRRSAEASRRGRGIRNTKRRGEAKKEKEWTGRG